VETHRPDSVGLDTTVTTSRSGCKHHCNGHPVVTVLYCELVYDFSRRSAGSAGSAGSAEGQPDQMLHSKEQQGGAASVASHGRAAAELGELHV
jgi:hypothetical protein